MIVTEDTIEEVIKELSKELILAFDTETTGLRPYHSDYPFCASIASKDKEYFFNFLPGKHNALTPNVLLPLISAPKIKWIMCNAKFDMAMMARYGIFFSGGICELQAMYRLWKNEDHDISLDEIAKQCGYQKSSAVEEYISRNGLYTNVDLTHVKRKRKDKHFDKVPLDILAPYAMQDARVTFDCFVYIKKYLDRVSGQTPETLPNIHKSFYQDMRMTEVLFNMENRGVLVDREYCNSSAKYYTEKLARLEEDFFHITGREFAKAPTLFKEIFEKEDFEYTDKGNPKFDKKAISKFSHPAARVVVEHSSAKKQVEYFLGFLYHMDQNDVIHSQFNQAGTITGRLSSSSPNLQNLTKPDKYDKSGESTEPTVRGAIVAREGYFFAMLDYEQIEYRVMLDMAHAKGLISQVKSGLDVHEATAKVAGVSRQQAKTVNFLTLYGGGLKKLAGDLNCTVDEARSIQNSIFRSAPEIKKFIKNVITTAELRGYVFNFMGRQYHFTDRSNAYKAPNHLVQGTCSEILKEAMINCVEFLKDKKTKLVLSIHDELVFEVFRGEEDVVPKLKAIMEEAYNYRYLPMAVDVEVGLNLADKLPFSDLALLYGKEEGDGIQGKGAEAPKSDTPHMGM
jgi:DNA polymerase-1